MKPARAIEHCARLLDRKAEQVTAELPPHANGLEQLEAAIRRRAFDDAAAIIRDFAAPRPAMIRPLGFFGRLEAHYRARRAAPLFYGRWKAFWNALEIARI
jgi:hypothetical protein